MTLVGITKRIYIKKKMNHNKILRLKIPPLSLSNFRALIQAQMNKHRNITAGTITKIKDIVIMATNAPSIIKILLNFKKNLFRYYFYNFTEMLQ